MSRRFSCVGALVSLLTACGDDGAGGGETAATGGTASADDDGTPTQADDDDDGDDGTPTSTSGVDDDGDPTTSVDDTGTGDDATGGEVLPSEGCGVAMDALVHLTAIADGRLAGSADGRNYEVDVHPAVFGTLGNATPQPVLFGIHGCYETIENARNNLFRYVELGGGDAARPFIAVYPKSLGDCWDTSPGSADHAYLEAIWEQVYADLCIDTQAVFFAGQSSGGYEAHSLPAFPIFGELDGHTAGIAVNAGGPPGGLPSPADVDATPLLGIHGTLDPIVAVEQGRAARDYWVDANGCSGSTIALDPLPEGCMPYDPGDPMQDQYDCECTRYDDCTSGAPIVWCEHRWDIHYMPDWGPAAILDFFLDLYYE